MPDPSPAPEPGELDNNDKPTPASGEASRGPKDEALDAASTGRSASPEGPVEAAPVPPAEPVRPVATVPGGDEPGGDQPIDNRPDDDDGPGVTDAPAPTSGPADKAPLDASDQDQDDDDDEVDEDDGDGDGEGPARSKGGLLTREVKVDLKLVLAMVAVVALVAFAFGAYKLGQRQAGTAAPGAPGTTSTTKYKVPADFTTFTDEATGVKLSIPRNWEQRSTANLPDKSLRLIAGIPNTNDSVSVRVTAYSSEITAENLKDQKNVVDGLLGEEAITVLVNQTLTLGGLPALFYVYRFTDQATSTAGIHAHFFVYQGRKMVSMVFQALPESRYELLAGTFDLVANSLQVAPGPPPAFLEPTPASPATTAAPGAPPSESAPPTSAATPPTTG